MIPKSMDLYLKEKVPEAAFINRLRKEDGKCFLEFGYKDEHLLSRLGIICDKLGPKLVVCMWDESSPIEISQSLATA